MLRNSSLNTKIPACNTLQLSSISTYFPHGFLSIVWGRGMDHSVNYSTSFKF